MKLYVYGMRLRGVAPKCQPVNGPVDWQDIEISNYHSIIVYDRELTPKECVEYELDFLKTLAADDCRGES